MDYGDQEGDWEMTEEEYTTIRVKKSIRDELATEAEYGGSVGGVLERILKEVKDYRRRCG
jgi:hypothetical protein